MLQQLFGKMLYTDKNNYSLLFLRVVAAIIILPHGAQKLFGWFGGYGLEGTLTAFSQYMGIPPALGFLNILAESIGGLILLAGLFTRISAFGLAVTMIVAGSTHISNGFFMNWSGTA
ncbi:MAG: DoxX family protein, partial [Ignavibacteriaceae bacterium]